MLKRRVNALSHTMFGNTQLSGVIVWFPYFRGILLRTGATATSLEAADVGGRFLEKSFGGKFDACPPREHCSMTKDANITIDSVTASPSLADFKFIAAIIGAGIGWRVRPVPPQSANFLDSITAHVKPKSVTRTFETDRSSHFYL